MSDGYYMALGCLGNIFRTTVVLSLIGLVAWALKSLLGLFGIHLGEDE